MFAAPITRKLKDSQFLELFLSLLQSGFSIPSALNILTKENDSKEFATKILKIIDSTGCFSKAICCISKKLKSYETLLITAEETGDVVPALNSIVEELKDNDTTRKNLLLVSVYPIIVCFLALALSTILVLYGLPYINLIAKVNENDFIKGIIYANIWIFSSVIVFFLCIRYFFCKYDFQYILFRNLYYLNLNSIGMEESFKVLLREKHFSKKQYLCISSIIRGLRNGNELSNICRLTGAFDAFTISWLFVSGKNGEVCNGLKKIYENYSKKRKSSRETAQRFLEPGIIAICGIYILILITSCVIPVFMSLGVKIL